MNIDDLTREAQHAAYLGMDALAASKYRRLAIIYQERANKRQQEAREAMKIDFEPLGDVWVNS